MTDEQRAKIRWLNRAFHAEKNAEAWLGKLERDRSTAERLSRGMEAGGASGSNGTENALIRLADTERETQEKLCELVRIREEIAAAIAQVDDLDAQTILVRHFLNYENFDMIAEKMNYSIRNVKYKYKAALDKVCIDLHSEMC